MYKIVICIPTYKRPIMLEKLVLSIIGNTIDKALIKNINIIIIDNDIDKSAEKIVNEMKHKCSAFNSLIYYNYPTKGLANLRNELFSKALALEPDYIVSIDDDEYVTHDWLNQLVLTIVNNEGDIVTGPVIPIMDRIVPDYISYWYNYTSYWYKEKDFVNNQRINSFKTGNYIINVDFLMKHKLEFDERFNKTGGEDTYFGLTAMKKGANIFWAEKAIAYETILEKRTTIAWLFSRRYRGAANFIFILKIEKQYFKIIRKFFISLAYIILGLFSMILILIPIKIKLWGILKLADGVGSIARLTNIKYEGY